MHASNSGVRRNDICVCILAHNEQKHIGSTIKSIVSGNREVDFDIVVYANGCTDDTAEIVANLFPIYSNLRLQKLNKASKSLAWNTAFNENKASVLIFSDGDVNPEPGSIKALWDCFKKDSAMTLASCQYWPQKKGLMLEQKLTGLMQIPLVQDFLTGCFYGVRRRNLAAQLKLNGLIGIPDGIVGEDLFLNCLMPEHNFTVINKKCYYEPPIFSDYKRYLSRVRWQDEQIASLCKGLLDSPDKRRRKLFDIYKKKKPYCQGAWRLFYGILATTLRHAFILINKKEIDQHYKTIGPVIRRGEKVLSNVTRSNSVK